MLSVAILFVSRETFKSVFYFLLFVSEYLFFIQWFVLLWFLFEEIEFLLFLRTQHLIQLMSIRSLKGTFVTS